MSEALERVSSEPVLVDPRTGEALTLRSPSEDLARYLDNLRRVEWDFRAQKRLVQDELLARMDREAKWTLHLPGVKITGQSPAPEEAWDGAELRETLLAYVDEGALTIEAVDAAVETVVTYKVHKAGVNALRKLGGEIAETVESLKRVDERDRRVSVRVMDV